jgi:hypothetical protein
MTVATNDQLTLLRSANQWSRAWLAIYKPNTIYTARLASVPSSTDMIGQIAYNSGSGTLGDVRTNMTLWVGTAAGKKDLGTARIRKDPISGTRSEERRVWKECQSQCRSRWSPYH